PYSIPQYLGNLVDAAPGLADRAVALLDAEVNRQALMIAYIDDFYLMMIMTLCTAPLLLLLRKASRRGGPTVMDWGRRPGPARMCARQARASIEAGDPVLDDGRDAAAPIAAVEDAVMADAPGEMIMLHPRRQRAGEVERGPGLADAGNIVALALDREQGDVAQRGGIDRPAAMGQPAPGQQVALEDDIDRLQVEFGGHVADRAIFVVEALGRLGAFAVALDEVAKHLPVADEMVAEVHRHESGELEEARIDATPGARIMTGHGDDHVALEPGIGALGSDGVDLGRRLAGVDRPAHHRQRLRPRRMIVGGHHAGGGEGRHRRLAYREHVRAGADMVE